VPRDSVIPRSKEMNRKFELRLTLWGLALLALPALGCGGGGSGAPAPAKPAKVQSDYGITAKVEIAGHPEQSGWVRVPPADWGSWNAKPLLGSSADPTAPAPTSLSFTPPPRHVEATVGNGAGGATDTDQRDAELNYAPGWSLLYWATSACFSASPELAKLEPQLYVSSTPWLVHNQQGVGRDYYVFGDANCSSGGCGFKNPDDLACDGLLAMQETLLCAADHLAQLGDSPGTVTWSGSDGSLVPGRPPTAITVTIPPQRSDDIFIARDMALNALAHLLRLDTKPRTFTLESVGNTPQTFQSTCTAQYAAIARDGDRSVENVLVRNTSTYFDPIPLGASPSVSDFQGAATLRLNRKANLLISAARLTKDLVERSVQDDISGAQQRLSSSGDYHDGARLAWGAKGGQSPYNTLSHAVRTLFGRLEIGNDANPNDFSLSPTGAFEYTGVPDWTPHDVTRDDPRCLLTARSDGTPFTLIGNGTPELGELSKIPGISARWDDAPPTTAGQSLALSMLDHAGIVIPPGLADSPAALAADQSDGLSALQHAVANIILDDAAIQSDAVSTSAFLATDAGAALVSTLKGISSAELSFALQRVYDAFRLLTETEPEAALDSVTASHDLALSATAAGLATRSEPAIESLGGIALLAPIPRDNLAIDPMARLSRPQAISNCGIFPAIGDSEANKLKYALGPQNTDVSAFQNPFFLAEGFRRVLASIAGGVAGTDALKGLTDFSKLGAAEVRTWAGPGTFLTTRAQDTGAQVVYLINLAPEDLGITAANSVDELTEIKQRLALVSTAGPVAVAANCAAGLLPPESCVGVSSVISVANAATAVSLDPDVAVGLDNPTVKVTFPENDGPNPGAHLVLLPASGKQGKVLAWLNGGTDSNEWFAEMFSNEQRTLAQRVVGIAQNAQTTRSCANIAPLALTEDYCIAGMKRDQFVPLANELNSTGLSTNVDDSWKNYLDLAQAAADKADQLGEQLIKEGLEQDLRKESATEELGALCGSYSSVDGVATTDGKVTPPSDDQQLSACVSAPTTDIVFLRDDPFVKLNPSDADSAIRGIYCGASASKPPFCARTSLVSHAGLGFQSAAAQPVSPGIATACEDVLNSLSPLPVSSGGTVAVQVQKAPFGNAIAEPWASAAGIASALQGLKLEEHADGEWILSVGSRIVSGSDGLIAAFLSSPSNASTELGEDIWPLCLHLPPTPGHPSTPRVCSPVGAFIGNLFPAELAALNDPTHAALRSAIEATVFYMGALAGELPAGAISMPVPVANRGSSAMTGATIPAPALYSVSVFEKNGVETAGDPLTLGTPKDLYTIANPGANGQYTGLVPWDNSEFEAMGGPAKPFVSSKELAYLAARQGTVPQPDWRSRVYEQAAQVAGSQGFLYVDTKNAALEFDPTLVPGSSGDRTATLQAWLTARADEFNSGSSTFLTTVQQATFLTAPAKTADTATPSPYKFCRQPGPVDGRSVCGGALVSPLFFYNYARSSGFVEQCDKDYVSTPLDVTVNARWHTSCFLADGTVVSRPPGDSCSGTESFAVPPSTAVTSQLVHYAFTDGIGWFSPEVAAGGTEKIHGEGYSWTSQENICQTSASSWAVDTSCPSYNWQGNKASWGVATSRSLWQDRLKPSVCSPQQRLELFLDNSLQTGLGDAQDRVAAMQTLVRVLGLSCISGNQHLGIRLKDAPPPIKTTEDMNVLESWLDLFGYDVDQIGNVVYLVDVPSDVVTVAKAGASDVGAVTSGDRGKLVLDLETKLNLLENGFSTLGTTFQQLSGAIDKTRLEITAAQLATNGQSLSISAAQIENDRKKSQAYLQFAAGIAKAAVASLTSASVSSAFSNGRDAANEFIEAASEIHGAQIDLGALEKSDQNLLDQQKNVSATGANSEAQAVLSLSQTTQGLYQTVNDTITGIKDNNNAALQDIDDLKQTAAKANIAMAKANGADFEEITGKSVPNHVNTVYRRQFDLTRQRYQLALESAKRTAYLARLSIEQRLGVRLDELHVNIGPLEAPATWADDLCTVQGVDYSKLRTATVGADPTSPSEVDTVKGFANQFVGNYIDKLRQFVQFYNVQFPFVDSTDVAVISLREDLPSSLSQCVGPSANLLLYSDSLIARSPDASSSTMTSHGGWRVTQCGLGACLRVQDGGVLVNGGTARAPLIAQPPGDIGHASLLTTVVDVAIPPDDAGVADPGSPPVPSAAPPAALFQTVSLRAGIRYVLSWWDMARNSDGTPLAANSGAAPYTATVFDSNWAVIGGGEPTMPAQSTNGITWSERRAVEIFAPADGEYHVLFSAGPAGIVGSAVAIANVQLEASSGNAGGATAYESNGASAMHATGNCAVDTPDLFRSRFVRKCDTSGCFFELKDVLAIDTQLLNQGSSSFIGKLAPGNFNYRNNTIALNVVGTGVIDCSRSPDNNCNGSAYVQYDLDHKAYDVPLEDYEGGTRCFDFGAGAVRSGKALASERFITLPMSSTDRELIEQSPFLKPEFSGRPLSGAYRLRIHDEPQLVWKNVNDIQIVMNYGYWSRVVRSPGN